MQLGVSKSHYKITPREKSGRGPGLGELRKIGDSPLIFLQRLNVATSKLADWWGLPKPIIKSHPEEKRRGHGLGQLTSMCVVTVDAKFIVIRIPVLQKNIQLSAGICLP